MLERYFLLSVMLTCISYGFVFSQELVELEVVGTAETVSDSMLPKKVYDKVGRVYRYSELGVLVIESEIEKLEYDSNNGIITSKSSGKADTLFLTRDERFVQIFWAQSYKLDVLLGDYKINFSSHQVWKIKVTGFKKREKILITINTIPDSARIYIDDNYVGYPGEYQLRGGEYTLNIKKDNYLDKKVKIYVHEDSTFDFNIFLEVGIKISGSPEDAQRRLDGKPVSNESESVIPGVHHLLISKSGYRTIDTTIVVTENDTDFSYKMSKQFARQRLEVYSVPVFRASSTYIWEYKIKTQYGFAVFINYYLQDIIGIHNLYLSLFGTIIKGRFEDFGHKEDRVWLLNAGLGLNQKFYLGEYGITLKGAYLFKTNQFENEVGLSITNKGIHYGIEVETQLIKNLFAGLEFRRLRHEYERLLSIPGFDPIKEKNILPGWEILGKYIFYIQRSSQN